MLPIGIKTEMLTWPPQRKMPWLVPVVEKPHETVLFAFVKSFITPGLFEELIFIEIVIYTTLASFVV